MASTPAIDRRPRARSRGRAGGRRARAQPTSTWTSSHAPSGESVDVGPRLRVGVLGPHDGVVDARRSRARGGAPCGGTGRRRDSGCRRSPSRRAPTRRCTPGCRGSPRRGRRRSAASSTRSTESSVPPSLVPTATSAPSGEASNQSMALAASAAPAAGSSSTTGGAVGVDSRAPGQQELLGAGRALEAEQAVAADLDGHRRPAAASARRGARATAPVGAGIERLTGVRVLGGDPLPDLGGVAVLQPAVRVGGPRRRGGRRRRRRAGSAGAASSTALGQPRPMLGRLPWLALERRSRALRFFVFFDIGERVVRAGDSAQAGSAPSMAATSLGSSGVDHRAEAGDVPSGSTRNFSKFQRMSPSWPSASATAVSSS